MAINKSFTLPMEGAREFWKNKIRLGPGQFARLAAEAKIRAFAISGIAKGEELATVFTALQRAIEEGTTFEDFKAECGDIFTRRGWVGKRSWRVDNVFRTNIQTAYNVGHYKQLKEETDVLPYWQYSAINDKRTRPTHLAMDGRVYPADHPTWNTWYPPNGYRCRCSVIGLTRSEVEKRGLKVETEDPTDLPIMGIDPKTGREELMPRQMLPDPGFDQHPGKLIWGGLVKDARRTFINLGEQAGPEAYRRVALQNVRPAEIPDLDEAKLLPGGQKDDFYISAFKSLYGEELVATDAAQEPVILSLRSYLLDKTPGARQQWKFSKSGHGISIPLLKEAIENPYEIWLTPQKDEASSMVRLSKRYISLWKTADKKRVAGLMVFEVVDGVFQGVTAFIPMKGQEVNLEYSERQRRGLLLYKR